MVAAMGKIINLPFRRMRLPRRLVNDGWWLESKPTRPVVVPLPARDLPGPKRGLRPKRRHLTLIISEK
jgi:hypothetical protein